MTSPEVERAVLCAYAEREVGREALESSSAVLQTAARPSQLPAQIGFVVGVARCDAGTKKGSGVWRDPRAFLEQCLHEEVVR